MYEAWRNRGISWRTDFKRLVNSIYSWFIVTKFTYNGEPIFVGPKIVNIAIISRGAYLQDSDKYDMDILKEIHAANYGNIRNIGAKIREDRVRLEEYVINLKVFDEMKNLALRDYKDSLKKIKDYLVWFNSLPNNW